MKKVTIGRSNENDICYANVPTISSFHSEIIAYDQPQEITYTDYSTNGSWVNDKKVHNSSCKIERGDIIKLPGNNIVNWEPYFFNTQGAEAINKEDNQQQQQQQEPQQKPWNNQSAYRELLTCNRGLLKYIFFTIITLGIYHIVVFSKISNEINIVARRDLRNTLHYCLLFFILSPITLGIMNLVWFHQLSNRIGRELRRRNIAYSFGAGHYWGWQILGSLIIIGPFIYIHQLMRSMNLLNDSFNTYGE